MSRAAKPADISQLQEVEEWRSGICGDGVRLESLELLEPRVELRGRWRAECQKVLPPQSVPRWDGQNSCWEWMKLARCHGDGEIPWVEAQRKVASMGMAPFPAEAVMEPLRNHSVCELPELGRLDKPPSSGERLADNQWLQDVVSVFVLNRPENTKQWSMMVHRLQELYVHFERIWAVNLTHLHTFGDGASLVGAPVEGEAALEAARRHQMLPEAYNFTDRELLTAAGTAAGHLLAMRQAVARARTPLVLILEDNVLLTDFFATRLRSLLQEAPCDWQAMSLKSRCPYGACVSPHLMRVMASGIEPSGGCRQGINRGMQAMLYRREQLEEIVATLWEVVWQQEHPLCLNVDVALAEVSDRVPYYAVPALQYPGFF